MQQIIHTHVDSQGNVSTDYAGYVGDACLAEEEAIRQELARLGLNLAEVSKKRKPPEALGAQTGTRPRISS